MSVSSFFFGCVEFGVGFDVASASVSLSQAPPVISLLRIHQPKNLPTSWPVSSQRPTNP